MKFSVKFINEQYKIFKFNIILKIHISSDKCDDQFRSLSKTFFLIYIRLININNCLTEKKRLKVCIVYFTIFKIKEICKVPF